LRMCEVNWFFVSWGRRYLTFYFLRFKI
jgi:hypothetical protein